MNIEMTAAPDEVNGYFDGSRNDFAAPEEPNEPRRAGGWRKVTLLCHFGQ
jgi:hypothetical protein